MSNYVQYITVCKKGNQSEIYKKKFLRYFPNMKFFFQLTTLIFTVSLIKKHKTYKEDLKTSLRS